MTDDIVARARAALEGVTRPWRWSGGEGDDPALVFIDAAPGLMSELLAEVERTKRACETLGGIVDNQCQMALDATGLHHLIDDDGDGDWGAVWENLAEQRAEVERLRGALERIKSSAESGAKGGLLVCEAIHEYIEAVLRGDQ